MNTWRLSFCLIKAVVNFKPDAGKKENNLQRMKGIATAASKQGDSHIITRFQKLKNLYILKLMRKLIILSSHIICKFTVSKLEKKSFFESEYVLSEGNGLFSTFLTPEEECNRSRSGMTSDNRSDIIDFYFPVQIREFGFDQICDCSCIFVAG